MPESSQKINVNLKAIPRVDVDARAVMCPTRQEVDEWIDKAPYTMKDGKTFTPSIDNLGMYSDCGPIKDVLDRVTAENAKARGKDFDRLRALGAEGVKALPASDPRRSEYTRLKGRAPTPVLVTADSKTGLRNYHACEGRFSGVYALDYDRDKADTPDHRPALLKNPHVYAITPSSNGLGAGVFVLIPNDVRDYLNSIKLREMPGKKGEWDRSPLTNAWRSINDQMIAQCDDIFPGLGVKYDANSNGGMRLRFVCDVVQYSEHAEIVPMPIDLAAVREAVEAPQKAKNKAAAKVQAEQAQKDAEQDAEQDAVSDYRDAFDIMAAQKYNALISLGKRAEAYEFNRSNADRNIDQFIRILCKAEAAFHAKNQSRHVALRSVSLTLVRRFKESDLSRDEIVGLCRVFASRIGFDRDLGEIDRLVDGALERVGALRGVAEAFKDLIHADSFDDAVERFFKAFDADYMLGSLDGKLALVRREDGKIYVAPDLNTWLSKTVACWEKESDGNGDGNGDEKPRKSKPHMIKFSKIMYHQDPDKFYRFVKRPDYFSDAPLTKISSGNETIAANAPVYLVNDAGNAPAFLPYTSDDVERMITLLCWIAERFDTPEEARWALSYMLCKARHGITYRPHTALFLVDDGVNNDGGRRGKTLVAEGLLKLLYGDERGAVGNHAHGIRAEENFDGDENLKLFHVVNELNMGSNAQERRANFEGLKDFITNDWYQLRQKGRDAQTVQLATLLCITSNGAKGLRVNASILARMGIFCFSRDVHDYYDDVKDMTLTDWMQDQSTVNDTWLEDHVYHYLGVKRSKPKIVIDGKENRDNEPSLARMRAALFDFAKAWDRFADVDADVNMMTRGVRLTAEQASLDNPKEDAVLDAIRNAGSTGILQSNIVAELRRNGIEMSGQALGRIMRGLKNNGLVEAIGSNWSGGHDTPIWRVTENNTADDKARTIKLTDNAWRDFRDEICKTANAMYNATDIPEMSDTETAASTDHKGNATETATSTDHKGNAVEIYPDARKTPDMQTCLDFIEKSMSDCQELIRRRAERGVTIDHSTAWDIITEAWESKHLYRAEWMNDYQRSPERHLDAMSSDVRVVAAETMRSKWKANDYQVAQSWSDQDWKVWADRCYIEFYEADEDEAELALERRWPELTKDNTQTNWEG